MKRKVDQIRSVWARIGAPRIAAQFVDRQIGKEPGQIVSAALELLAKRFELALIVSHRDHRGAHLSPTQAECSILAVAFCGHCRRAS